MNSVNYTLEHCDNINFDLVHQMLGLAATLIMQGWVFTRDLRAKKSDGGDAPKVRTTSWVKLRRYIKLELIEGVCNAQHMSCRLRVCDFIGSCAPLSSSSL
jgi:hypothetical protein